MSALNQIYHVKINSLQGKPVNLLDYKGKKILFVNVASKCGFTPQYRDLQKLYDQYQDQLILLDRLTYKLFQISQVSRFFYS